MPKQSDCTALISGIGKSGTEPHSLAADEDSLRVNQIDHRNQPATDLLSLFVEEQQRLGTTISGRDFEIERNHDPERTCNLTPRR